MKTQLTTDDVAALTAGADFERAQALHMAIVNLTQAYDADTVINALVMVGVNKIVAEVLDDDRRPVVPSVAAGLFIDRLEYWHDMFAARESK